MPRDRYLSMEDTAARYDRTVRTIERWPKQFGFPRPHHRAFRQKWYSLEELQDFEAKFSNRLGVKGD